MADIAPWTIEFSSTLTTADFLDGQLFDTQPGTNATARFVFASDGVDSSPGTRHADLQQHVDAAQPRTTIRVGTTSTGQPYYREELAGFGDVDSLLVALVPDSGRGGVWAVLRDGRDATLSIERDVFVWELDVTVLERYESSDFRSRVEDDYSDEVL